MKIFELCQYCIRWTNYVPPARCANQLHFLFCRSPNTRYLFSRQPKPGYVVSARDLRKDIIGNEIQFRVPNRLVLSDLSVGTLRPYPCLNSLRQCSSIHTFTSPV